MKPLSFFALVFAIYLLSFWGAPFPYTGDQRTYLSIAMEMRERGSWLIPYLFESPNFLKPPFQYWMTLVGWKLFGFSLFGALIPSVLATVFSGFFIYRISKALGFKQSDALFSGLLFLGSVGTLTYGTTAQMDIWIVLFWLMSWDFSFRYFQDWKAKNLFMAWFVAGLMSLLKGPLYPVLFAAAFFVNWFLSARSTSNLNLQKFFLLVLAALFGAILGLVWFIAAYQVHPKELMDYFFHVENMEKLGGNQSTALGLWGSFLVSLFPVLFWFFRAPDWKLFRLAFQTKVMIAFLPIAIFFTVFPYRVGSYLFPLTVVVVLVAPAFLQKFLNAILAFVGAIFFCTMLVFLKLTQLEWISSVTLIGLSASVLFLIFSLWKNRPVGFALASVLFLSWLRIGTVESTNPEYRTLATTLQQQPEAPVFMKASHRTIWHEYGWLSTILGRRIRLAPPQQISESHWMIFDEGEFAANSDSEKKNCTPWERLGKRSAISLDQFIHDLPKRGDPRISRQFFVCWVGR